MQVLEKADTMGISVSGIFLLGSYFIEKLPVEASATDLITMAATNYFHNPKENISQRTLLMKPLHSHPLNMLQLYF